ncbi:hypothetical protein Pyn_30132 [Prunus yedoensis var. nudiflora]|uniref:Uncharacterized protein n=1 Tax=Prunus yedoensis var. nudiflora TaxID=2094558 RepID=A0A314XFR0_PRUYE|nr:hypothetical protein Pyn_30132 [Prunus yedoensis var. nudiflora]
MGKVHGSLARAGKVRGQTPKVAKQDKKKKPRGRAHKRMQYNRRFVTAVVGFGKKRGPNSSENFIDDIFSFWLFASHKPFVTVPFSTTDNIAPILTTASLFHSLLIDSP